jgi:hypothetical protein
MEHGAWREGEKSGKSEKGKSRRQGEGVIQVPGTRFPAYALLSYGVASRCLVRETKKLKPLSL